MAIPDDETCYRAVQSHDARFDGWFFTAVRTTHIYCRPSCPAIVPKRQNVSFYPSAAAAQSAGYRACKRCRPDASPGSPEWDARGDLVGRAMRLIRDGIVDTEGVAGLANRLGYSKRQVNRSLVDEVGAGPLALARAQRAQTARILLETTEMTSADVAFASGFASVRQFNETVQAVFATTPSALRAKQRLPVPAAGAALELRLPFRSPIDVHAILEFFGRRAIPSIESYDGVTLTRTLDLSGGPARVEISNGQDHIRCRLTLSDQRDLISAVARVRRMLDLDADPVAIDERLATDLHLGPMILKRPGLRSPGAADAFEMAIRAVIGQQISVSGACTLLGRITEQFGAVAFAGEKWRAFPSPASVAAIDLADLPVPKARAHTLHAIAAAFINGQLTLDTGADRRMERDRLLALPGIGPWTADYLLMRAMGDPDVLPASDLGVRKAAGALDIKLDGGRADWAPWRSYATHHLWTSLGAT